MDIQCNSSGSLCGGGVVCSGNCLNNIGCWGLLMAQIIGAVLVVILGGFLMWAVCWVAYFLLDSMEASYEDSRGV